MKVESGLLDIKVLFKDEEPIERPKNEKKFSLKNSEDKAIIISFSIVFLVVIVILFLIVYFSGLLDFSSPSNSSINSSLDINSLK